MRADFSLTLSHYEAYTLLNAIDTGAARPIDDVRRIRRLSMSFAVALGSFFESMEDIVTKYRLRRAEVPTTPQDVWRSEMNQIAAAEAAEMGVLIAEWANDVPVTLTFSKGDFEAIKRWWKEMTAFPSKGPMAEAAVAIDDALKAPVDLNADERVEVEV